MPKHTKRTTTTRKTTACKAKARKAKATGAKATGCMGKNDAIPKTLAQPDAHVKHVGSTKDSSSAGTGSKATITNATGGKATGTITNGTGGKATSGNGKGRNGAGPKALSTGTIHGNEATDRGKRRIARNLMKKKLAMDKKLNEDAMNKKLKKDATTKTGAHGDAKSMGSSEVAENLRQEQRNTSK